MKLAAKLLMLISLTATFAVAQISQGTFKHIIIVVQENRTPDNLFGAGAGPYPTCGSEYDFESGVDIDNGAPNDKQGQPNPTCNASTNLATSCDTKHDHVDFTNECDLDSNGNCKMDGACSNDTTGTCSGTCPQYAYVPKLDVQPYYDIANDYGFANYMFQTNEGPSFPAHQFLFAGTSAPVAYNDSSGQWTWFVAENPDGITAPGYNTGCTTLVTEPNEFARTIDSSGNEKSAMHCDTNQGSPYCLRTCYERAPSPYNYGSLADLLHYNSIGWTYYTPKWSTNTDNIDSGLWVAPIAINHFCDAGYDNQNNYICRGLRGQGTYAANMRYETAAHPFPLYDDITACSLAAVSWAIPDAKWSDHAGAGENTGSGPYYVANIVNAVGKATTCDGGAGYWSDTAILIVWDDWGGFVDHVNPNPYPGVWQGSAAWGNWYTYGFRVPFLVVSAYTGVSNGNGTYSPYISGACGGSGQPTCPNNVAPFVHDFGSILAFIEWNFLGQNAIGTIGQGYKFADNYAPELPNNIPLLDFFPLTMPRNFVQIGVPTQYNVTYFQNYFTNNPTATPNGPDADY